MFTRTKFLFYKRKLNNLKKLKENICIPIACKWQTFCSIKLLYGIIVIFYSLITCLVNFFEQLRLDILSGLMYLLIFKNNIPK